MTKTFALLLDAYRELNAKRLFWIVLLLSGIIVGAFAMIGITGDYITILGWKSPIPSGPFSFFQPALLYEYMFRTFGVGFWLTWLANILALVSTAGIFPDFMADGAIDLYLAKPISRFRLFATKYMGGLLFVTAQVTIFTLGCFLVLGFRGKMWAPIVFVSIPVVVLVFSYLFSICVLFGVLTRSTITSLLLTLLCWFLIWGAQTTESILLTLSIQANYEVISLDQEIAQTQSQIANYSTSRPASRPTTEEGISSFRNMIPFGLFSGRQTRSDLKAKLEDLQTRRKEKTGTIHTAESIALGVITVLPKTQATKELLDRALATNPAFKDSEIDASPPEVSDDNHRRGRGENRREEQYLAQEAKKAQDKRSVTWVTCTSLVFEAVMVSLAGWLFCRRDY